MIELVNYYCFHILKAKWQLYVELEALEVLEKKVCWQTVINDKRPKLKVKLNGIEIEGLLDSDTDVSVISKESWDLNWPLQEISTQFVGITTLYQVKKSVEWIKCVGPEGQVEMLKLYVADIAMNLLQQWEAQINIPTLK